MLKRITLLAVILIFAKPAYDIFMEEYAANEMTPTAINPVEVQLSNEEKVTLSSEDPATQLASLPNKITSVEQLTEAFYYYFSQFEENFTLQYVGSTKNIDDIIEQASKEASKRDPFVDGHLSERNIKYSYNMLSAKIEVSQTYLISKEEAMAVNDSIGQLVDSVQDQNMSDIDKVKFVNDYIVQNTSYSDQTNGSPHSAYTALAERKAVCQGYALLTQQMLTALGVESLYVVGYADGVGHAWNLVKLEGQWYHLDTTWNDPLPDRGKSVRYDYFLVTDSQLAKDHTWERADYPQANSTKYAYMQVGR